MSAKVRFTCAILGVVTLAGCGSSNSAQPQDRVPERTTITAKPVPPYWCNGVGKGIPPSGHGNGNHVANIYANKSKGPLSETDCAVMTRQWDGLIAATAKFNTRAKAEAVGYHAAAEYVVGLGSHHTSGKDVIPKATAANAVFNPSKPGFLIFGGTSGAAPLVGVAYTYLGTGLPPEGFAGGNDWWHEHTTICMGGVDKILAGAESISDAACAKLGGFNAHLTGPGGIFGEKNKFYMLHVWLPPYEYRPDVFVSGNACLLADGLAPKSNPCWAQLARDPSLGPLPGAHDMDAHSIEN